MSDPECSSAPHNEFCDIAGRLIHHSFACSLKCHLHLLFIMNTMRRSTWHRDQYIFRRQCQSVLSYNYVTRVKLLIAHAPTTHKLVNNLPPAR
jgi:hypothetical protein